MEQAANRYSGFLSIWHKAEKFTNIAKEDIMLYWALVFFIVSIIAAVFGFGGISAASAGVAKILFYIFLVLFILSLIFGFIKRPPAV